SISARHVTRYPPSPIRTSVSYGPEYSSKSDRRNNQHNRSTTDHPTTSLSTRWRAAGRTHPIMPGTDRLRSGGYPALRFVGPCTQNRSLSAASEPDLCTSEHRLTSSVRRLCCD